VPGATTGAGADQSATPPGATAGGVAGGFLPGGGGLAVPASAERSLVASVTGFYAVLLFLAATAVLLLLGLHKARTT
jgi:hypothetical protein